MSCPEPVCKLITCPVTDSIPFYDGVFSLQNGTFYTNNEISVPVNYGNGTYIVPPGTINVTVPPNGGAISYQGCISTVSFPVAAGSTQSQIQSIVTNLMNQVATQLSQCNAPTPSNPTNPSQNPSAPPVFWNTALTVGCSNAPQMKLIGDVSGLVTFTINGLQIPARIFSSTVSQADANLQASTYLTQIISSGAVECGWWNTEQTHTCQGGAVQTIPADTYFSTVSQADADSQAQTAAQNLCKPDWSQLLWQAPVITGDPGSITGSGFTPTAGNRGATGAGFIGLNAAVLGPPQSVSLSATATLSYTGGPWNCAVGYGVSNSDFSNVYWDVILTSSAGQNFDMSVNPTPNYFTLPYSAVPATYTVTIKLDLSILSSPLSQTVTLENATFYNV